MSSAKPYLIRALHQWIIDNGMTPLIVVQQGENEKIQIPSHLLNDEAVVFNVSWEAARELQIENDLISFSARFSGKPHSICIPVQLVSAIYSRENGKGMMFEVDEVLRTGVLSDEQSNHTTEDEKPHLRLLD